MSNPPPRIHLYSNRGQGVLLVLHALQELGGSNTKAEVIGKISSCHWYDVSRHDLPPYEGKEEPKYHTLLAWARKDCYEREWMLRAGWNDWSISRDGRSVLEDVIQRFRSRRLDVSRCYLWTASFKKMLDPAYVPSNGDAIRPEEVSDDYWIL
jgi:hypothetical protein